MATGFDAFSFDTRTLAQCKKHNRYQRCDFWESKAITKLLDAIELGMVPVGKCLRNLEIETPEPNEPT